MQRIKEEGDSFSNQEHDETNRKNISDESKAKISKIKKTIDDLQLTDFTLQA